MTFELKTPYAEYKRCYFYTDHYMVNGNLFIGIAQDSADDGEVDYIMNVTVNTDVPLPDGCIAVKDYSENEGILETMKALGLVTEILAYLPSGYVSIPICRYDKSVLQKYSH